MHSLFMTVSFIVLITPLKTKCGGWMGVGKCLSDESDCHTNMRTRVQTLRTYANAGWSALESRDGDLPQQAGRQAQFYQHALV